jgi:hypothetical protein
MMPSPLTCLSSGRNAILAAWRPISSVKDALARFRTITCYECCHRIRWWKHRVCLIEGERYAHVECFKGELFLKAFVAKEIRRSRLVADEFRRPQELPPLGIF